jgi:O-methyltransferase
MSIGNQKDDSAVGLYLDLLKKTLTNTIYTAEPGEESEAIFVRGFIDHYIQGTAISMLPMARLNNLQLCIDNVLKNGVPGT